MELTFHIQRKYKTALIWIIVAPQSEDKIVRFSAIQIQYETVINNQWKQWLLMDKIYIFAIQMLIS
jgi:hypothetical protein